ncbi:dihydrodipicolinate reductase C-terminal domain-containing protein [Streptomyces sp. NPDC087300]|uniref:dihydrodipicolinate reductase C-terminal domain-containing protein n=1 Tax=Streptomyces sp. NPDC087300 TaxID=3365780 RepID=UPI0037F1F473
MSGGPHDGSGQGALTRIGVLGLGRLGRAVARAAQEQGLRVVEIGRWGEWPTGDHAPPVLIDASAPEAQPALLDHCAQQGTALVECVSNLSAAQWTALGELATRVPVVRAPNLSLGHHVQRQLVRLVGALHPIGAQPPEATVWERHPVTKAHRPSASAVRLADAWREASGHPAASVDSRRAGGPVSDHEVQFAWRAESLTVRHSVASLDAAAFGALAAARWAVGGPPGITDVSAVFDELAHSARERERCQS